MIRPIALVTLLACGVALSQDRVTAVFDTSQPVTITGTICSREFAAPRSYV